MGWLGINPSDCGKLNISFGPYRDFTFSSNLFKELPNETFFLTIGDFTGLIVLGNLILVDLTVVSDLRGDFFCTLMLLPRINIL